jgi:hypothetical protein
MPGYTGGERMKEPKTTFMNHPANSAVWHDFLSALTQKYSKFWLISNRYIKRLVEAHIPKENLRRRKNEYQTIISFKKAYLFKVRHGEIEDPIIKPKKPLRNLGSCLKKIKSRLVAKNLQILFLWRFKCVKGGSLSFCDENQKIFQIR